MRIDITEEVITSIDNDVPVPFEREAVEARGAFEEWKLWSVGGVWGEPMRTQIFGHPLDEEQVAALRVLFPDMGANMEPGAVAELNLVLKYRFDYGRPRPVTVGS